MKANFMRNKQLSYIRKEKGETNEIKSISRGVALFLS
jgi:hypothetical protein